MDHDEPVPPLDVELETLVRGLGATDEQLVEFADELDTLGLALAMQPGPAVFTVAQLAEHSGLPLDSVLAYRTSMGLRAVGGGELVGGERDVALFTSLRETAEVFGDASVAGIARVVGSAAATIADAVTSAFLVNVELPHRDVGRTAFR